MESEYCLVEFKSSGNIYLATKELGGQVILQGQFLVKDKDKARYRFPSTAYLVVAGACFRIVSYDTPHDADLSKTSCPPEDG